MGVFAILMNVFTPRNYRQTRSRQEWQLRRYSGCFSNTAATTLNGLVDLNLFTKEKIGRKWIYTMFDADQIISNWQA